MKNKLPPEELALFRRAMQGVKPLKSAKAKVVPKPPAVVLRKRKPPEEPLEADTFSDFESLDPVSSEDNLSFARSGISSRLLRRLRRGEAELEAKLDLHGKTVVEARQALHRFLLDCHEQGLKQVLIVHGKGRAGSQPILKNKLNHWLRQSELVLAFCSARIKDGGTGALYLLIKSLS